MKLAKFIDLIKSGQLSHFSKPHEIEALAAYCFFRFPGIPLESFEKELSQHIDFSVFTPLFKELSSLDKRVSSLNENVRFINESPYINYNGTFNGWERHLPHLHQDGKLQFMTFRLADSLPQTKLNELREYKINFEKHNPKPWNTATSNQYHRAINSKTEYWLEQGYGDCVLRSPDVRQILIDAFDFVNNGRCLILGYVIMPNHVHILLIPLGNNDTSEVMGSVRRFSANRINKLLGRSGRLWSQEVFDRMIRSNEHLEYCINYLKNNPRHLAPGEFTIYFNYNLKNYIR